MKELSISLKIIFNNQLNWLLVFAPIALFGAKTEKLGEAACFLFAGLALIPFAERLSMVTEQVAEHTNETIGALLNATFGNAPEFLISSAALRSGLYRIVQLTLLGSVLCNLLFVFGLSCLIGGMRWQVQELRITSGNTSIGMLLLSTMGLLLPAALKMGSETVHTEDDKKYDNGDVDFINPSDVAFSRCNSLVMAVGYICYLIFQLGSHKEEFEYGGDEYAVYGGGHNIVRTPNYDGGRKKAAPRRNMFCKKYCFFMNFCPNDRERDESYDQLGNHTHRSSRDYYDDDDDDNTSMPQSLEDGEDHGTDGLINGGGGGGGMETSLKLRRKVQDTVEDNQDFEHKEAPEPDEPIMSMRMGLLWLGIITMCISLLSDVIVDSIDGFATRSKLSEVFTSVVVIPYFSNIAEQVSAVIFAYRNKMDLCVGVTVGSAVQIAQFVMPGCVLVGWIMDRPMTLYYRSYETICLLLGVLCVAAVLQGGTTNWLAGVVFIGLYLMIAAGFCFHVQEDLTDEMD